MADENKSITEGHVDFVGAGPGDPDLLTRAALLAFEAADVVLHDRLISTEVLALAGQTATLVDVGKAGFGPSWAQADIDALLVELASDGSHLVRLKSGDPTVFGRLDEEIVAVDAAGLTWRIVPGITAASAAVAGIGQSLTRRGRNSAVRFLTGHDMQGFADHDWTTLAKRDQVAAIYMGKKSARFVQGRLLMHGADRATPVTLVENASRADQRVLATTLDHLPTALSDADMTGPVLTLLGLEPRAATHTISTLQKELA